MITTLNYNNAMYQTSYDDRYNGVLNVGNGTSSGTGTLLYDGKTILTAAHVFDSEDDNNKVYVYVDTANGYMTLEGTLKLYEQYDDVNSTGDIALITLDDNLDAFYNRYQIYRNSNEIGQDFTMAGYGNLGTGYRGEGSNFNNTKLITQNTFEVDMYDVYTSPDTNLAWTPKEGATLAADFDSGYSSNDVFGNMFNYSDTGVGYMEGMIASGDSGGPAFIDNAVAGVASYSASLTNEDLNNESDSSFGEIAAWQRVSYYSEWIDKEIRANYEAIPMTSEDVQTSVAESDDDISYAYFMLDYTQNRSLIEDNIILNYTTKDGIATAGEDYIFTSGTVTLYSDESSVFIPVEIIGDSIPEIDETFYLEVSNPSHGSFGDDTVSLTAVRTIIDNDGYIA